MTPRLLVSLVSVLLFAVPCLASAYGRYDPQKNTWNATHIVIVENGKVIESWLGDLKVGDKLPKVPARSTQMPVPGSPPPPLGKQVPPVSGKRMVLFMAFVPAEGEDAKNKVWTGADAPGLRNNPVSERSAAWIENDRVYSAYHMSNPGELALKDAGSVAGLKQRVDFGLALRTQFEAAKADKDAGQRAERVAFLTPVVVQYAGYYGECDCFDVLGESGKAAVPYLSRWATEENGKHWRKALSTLSRTGDDGFDAMVKVLDEEAKFWIAVAEELGPTEWIDQTPRTDIHAWRGPFHLRSVVQAAYSMKLSAENREKLQKHTGLRDLDKLLRQPRMKPEKSDMEKAHAIIQNILAGRFRREE